MLLKRLRLYHQFCEPERRLITKLTVSRQQQQMHRAAVNRFITSTHIKLVFVRRAPRWFVPQSTGVWKTAELKPLGGPSQENTAKRCWLPTKYRPLVLCREKLLKRVPHLINTAQNLAPFFTKCREYGLKLLWDPWTETWAHRLWKQKQPAKKMRLFPPKKYHLI